MPGMYPLYQAPSGRLFIRAAVAEPASLTKQPARKGDLRDAVLIVGVVELPESIELERVHTARLNDALWVDPGNARVPTGQTGAKVDCLDETTLGHLLTTMTFRRGTLPDGLEVFVRGTHLKHDRAGMRWAYVAAVMGRRPAGAPVDGVYALNGAQGLSLVKAGHFPGETPDHVLGKAFWGPGGRYGLTTTMEPTGFPAWLEQERERQHKRGGEPMFLEFAKRMQQRMPAKLFYTAEELEARERVSKQVLREIMAAEGQSEAPVAPSRRVRP